MASEIDEVELNLKSYDEYRKLFNKGEINDAYRVFEQRPGLVEFLPIGMIASDYTEIKRWVGDNQSKRFLIVVKKEIKKTLEKYINDADFWIQHLEEQDRIWFEQHFGDIGKG